MRNDNSTLRLCLFQCKIFSRCKIFSGVKYFRERKIFSSVWLHYENCSRKCFHVFGCILKMLFSYYFLTFSHPFSQLPNKFYNRKFQSINLKKQKSKQHHSLNSTVRSNWEREEERVIKNGGKGRDRSGWWVTTRRWRDRSGWWVTTREQWDWWWVMTRGRRDRSWVMTALMRLVLGGSVWGDAIFGGSVWVDQSSVGYNRSGWISLWWWCDLGGGVRYMAAPVLGCDWWIHNSLFFLPLYLSLCASDPKMVCSEDRNVKPFPGQSIILHGQLKWFYGKFYFPCATKHALRCKTISWNGFTPKQTEPKSMLFYIRKGNKLTSI